ncbi:phage holin family protein [Natronincola ferrireducens]|uniref:4 TMS phage holin, superfamily IV n=1 Tax=Natronincola ferrireducens TaxID=393762 RepID=A0A1G9I8S6_9FIRM|nr:phage holin family protein [Natronincola ferrireducens]SDL21486.1 4 TMS phage holin, superfamily IV [Natronincola ferrireducens]
MSEERNPNRTQDAPSWGKLFLRFIISAIVIAIAAFITPGFRIEGLWGVVFAALAISIINYLIERVFNFDASPFGRGIVGFLVAAVVIYISQFVVPAMTVTFLGAIIGAIVIGIIDMVIPGKTI